MDRSDDPPGPDDRQYAWYLSNLPAWRAFRRALRDPAAAQANVLREIIRGSRDTVFGREHRIDTIRTLDEFRDRVPIRDYSEFEPWIDRIRTSEPRVLTQERVLRLATTSGTTAARKLIPYTASLQSQFNRAIGPWIVDLFNRIPSLMAGRAYWSISPAMRDAADDASAVPIGFAEDSEYLGGVRKRLVDAAMAVPSSVARASSIDAWKELTMRHLETTRDLRLISIWHPSFLELLLGDRDAVSLWPDLKLVSCWGDAHAATQLDSLHRRFPNVIIQPKGLIATEVIVSIPFQRHWPLAIRSHFFEFIDASETIHAAHELLVGREYDVIITTGGGLFRYRLNDRVRVDAILAGTPSIRFVGKVGGFSDRVGEKLSEIFVADVLGNLRDRWTFAMLAPQGSRYVLFVEGECSDQLALQLDERLRSNPHYAYARDLEQLDAPRVFKIDRDAAAAFTARLHQAGQKLGDIKPAALSPLDGWDQLFIGRYLYNENTPSSRT